MRRHAHDNAKRSRFGNLKLREEITVETEEGKLICG
jgi:hypothetical protein